MPLGPEPRYLSNYVGLRNRLSVLDEQYPYVDFETRVKGAHSLMLSFLDYLATHRDEVVALVGAADRRTIARGANPGAERCLRDRHRAHRAQAQAHDPGLRDGGDRHRQPLSEGPPDRGQAHLQRRSVPREIRPEAHGAATARLPRHGPGPGRDRQDPRAWHRGAAPRRACHPDRGGVQRDEAQRFPEFRPGPLHRARSRARTQRRK